MLVTEKCAKILNCRVADLRDRLNHPIDRARVMDVLKGQSVQTTYSDRNGFSKTFTIGGITTLGADEVMAYGRLSKVYNVCVSAHFYVRHRIKLHHPFLHCLIERFPDGQEDRFYPMELCKLSGFGNLFTEIDGAQNCENKEEAMSIDEEQDEFDKFAEREKLSQDKFYSIW